MASCKHTSKTSYEETQFEWELTDYFLNNVTESDEHINSGSFHFGKSSWRLRLSRFPSSDSEYLSIETEHDELAENGELEELAENDELEELTENDELEVEYEIGLKKVDGSVERFCTGKISKNVDFPRTAFVHISKSKFVKRKHDLTPPNGLTILCILRRGTDRPFLFHQAPPTKFIKLDMLSENFKKFTENKYSCDVILKVKEKEFPAHKAILMARSPVFAAMFEHDTSEKRTGIIDIPDCDPDSFHEFLDYLYCGKLEGISFRSAFHLYKTSDKYSARELMAFCVEYMKQCLTEDNVCDVVKLAELYSETRLMAAAQVFFNDNVSKVVVTTSWESLMETNHRLANKLIIEMVSTIKNN